VTVQKVTVSLKISHPEKQRVALMALTVPVTPSPGDELELPGWTGVVDCRRIMADKKIIVKLRPNNRYYKPPKEKLEAFALQLAGLGWKIDPPLEQDTKQRPAPLTVRERDNYLKVGGTVCPKCASNNITTDSPATVSDGRLTANCACLACRYEWVDVFTLTDKELLVPLSSDNLFDTRMLAEIAKQAEQETLLRKVCERAAKELDFLGEGAGESGHKLVEKLKSAGRGDTLSDDDD